MTNEKLNYKHHIGIDVSKFTLEVGFPESRTTTTFDNNKEGWRQMWKEMRKSLQNALVVVETTGWYERGVLHYLAGKNVAVHRASARQVKQFIASYGILAKTDAVDARALAQYAKERAEILVCYDVPDKKQEQLQILYARYFDLKKMMVQEKNRLQAPGYKQLEGSVRRVIKALDEQAKTMLSRIREIIENDANLYKKYQTLRTIDGIGEITAFALLASMPELGRLNRKQAASLAGLAPHPKDSGRKTGYRKTRGGRAGIREVVNMAALGAVRKKHSKLKHFYDHLIEDNNKKPMVALTAVKRKIIIIANARIAELENYDLGENHS